MLDRIARNWSTVVVPVIDVILDDTIQYKRLLGEDIQVGGFSWGLVFNWHILPERERKRRDHKDYLPMWYVAMHALPPYVLCPLGSGSLLDYNDYMPR
jgi:polypeptide N-acetylgalactosaminyltransferase